MPRAAPADGRTEVRILSIFAQPRTDDPKKTKGSGMLCVENDDESAALQCELLAALVRIADVVLDMAAPMRQTPRPPMEKMSSSRTPGKVRRALDSTLPSQDGRFHRRPRNRQYSVHGY